METGKKYDQGKTRMDLVPLSVVESIAKILGMGAEKYGENNWQNIPDFWKRYKAALLRHLTAIDKGELIDPESGLPHIDHVLCNAAFLSWGHHHGKAISINEQDVDEIISNEINKQFDAPDCIWDDFKTEHNECETDTK